MNTKEAFEKKMEMQLNKWEKSIREMEAEAERLEAEADAEKADAALKQQVFQKVETIKYNYEQARKKLQKLRESGEQSWDRIRNDVEATWKNLGEALKETSSKLKQ